MPIILSKKPGGGGGPGGGVTSLNADGDPALTGAVVLSEGNGVTLTQVGQDIEIATTAAATTWDDVVRKAADQSVTSSTTLVDDDELFFTAVVDISYYFELVVRYGASSAGDIKHDFNPSAGAFHAAAWRQHIGLGPTTGNIQAGQVADMTTDIVNAGGVDPVSVVRVVGAFSLQTSGGTVSLRWAQNTSDATATIVKAGSYLAYRALD